MRSGYDSPWPLLSQETMMTVFTLVASLLATLTLLPLTLATHGLFPDKRLRTHFTVMPPLVCCFREAESLRAGGLQLAPPAPLQGSRAGEVSRSSGPPAPPVHWVHLSPLVSVQFILQECQPHAGHCGLALDVRGEVQQ